MIEVAGFRYACGRGTARSACWLAKVIALTYTMAIVALVLRAGRWPDVVVALANCMVFTSLPIAGVLFYILHLTFHHAEKQSIGLPPPVAEQRRHSRSWLRLMPIWLGAAMSPSLVIASFATQRLHGAGLLLGGSTEIVLMLWHVHAIRRFVSRMSNCASRGGGQPYWQFDFDRFDASDEGRFRARFSRHRDWKFPGSIIHPVEADLYAGRARRQRFNNLAAAAGSALIAIVFAQQVLADAMRTTVHDITHITDSPHPQPGFLYLCTVQIALILFLTPVGFHWRAGEIDSLTKLYEERGDLLASGL